MPHRDNLLLASLSPGDLAALQPHLKLVNFEQEQVLFEAGDTIDATYFPTSAVISIVVRPALYSAGVPSVRGSRQFRPNVSEPKPRRSISVVGYRPHVSAALLSLPSIPFCICRCHALSCAAG
jgi:hypothetical protein